MADKLAFAGKESAPLRQYLPWVTLCWTMTLGSLLLLPTIRVNPKPFTWTADPRRVLAAIKRGKSALELGHRR